MQEKKMEAWRVLENYLEENNLTRRKFATMCRLSIVSIYKYLMGEPISRISAKKIEKATNAKIKYEDLTDRLKKE